MSHQTVLDFIKQYIDQFENFVKKHRGLIPHSVSFGSSKTRKHIAFCAIIHGDEIGALPAFLHAVKQFSTGTYKFDGQVTFFLGNVPAALQNKRFIERDLNRSFDVDTMPNDNTYERKRAAEIKQLLHHCDVLFDFHQTSQITKYPFYAFGFHYESYLWARSCGGTQMFVTRPAKQKFSAGGLCIDEYMRAQGKPAVTLELSQRGFTDTAHNITILIIKRALKIYQNMLNIADINTLKKHAKKNRNLHFLLTVYKEPFSHPQKKLNVGFVNFSYVSKSDVVGMDETGREIKVPFSGFLLFPKYPTRDELGNSLENQTELFILVQSSFGIQN